MRPKWLKKSTPQQMGRAFEKELAKKVGGRLQPASGALPFAKEDILEENYLIQAKATTKQSYILKLEDLETLRENALKIGKIPLLVLKIGGREYSITERR